MHQHSRSSRNQRTRLRLGGQGDEGDRHLQQTVRLIGMQRPPAIDGPAQTAALGWVHHRSPPGGRAPTFHFHKQQAPAFDQQQIQLTQRHRQLRSNSCQPLAISIRSTCISAAAPRSCGVMLRLGCMEKAFPHRPWALGSRQSWTLRMRSRLRCLLGALCLALLLFTSTPAAEAAIDVAKQVLIGSDYSGKDLRGATFNLSNLREANLSGSDLRGASLYGAKLQDADLSNTDLREATLDSAVLTGTNLSGAVLELSLIHISEPTRQAKSRMPSSA